MIVVALSMTNSSSEGPTIGEPSGFFATGTLIVSRLPPAATPAIPAAGDDRVALAHQESIPGVGRLVGSFPPLPSLNTLRTPIDGKNGLSRLPRLFM